MKQMKHFARSIGIIMLLVLLSGCYHAKVTSGLMPSALVVDKPFASGWIYGLVPPNTVKAAEECTAGVAMVETKLSFVNQLVNYLTLGIYTPMHIRVTCAADSGASSETRHDPIILSRSAPDEDVVHVFARAADVAAQTGQSVQVRFH